MRNLAGTGDDAAAVRELDEAGISVRCLYEDEQPDEARLTLRGELGNWTFSRAWTYWVAHCKYGKSGLTIDQVNGLLRAREASKPESGYPYGRHDVRVSGSCTCPMADEVWTTDTDEVHAANVRSILDHNERSTMKLDVNRVVQRTADEKITDFHIDTQEGLNAFANLLRRTMTRDSFPEFRHPSGVRQPPPLPEGSFGRELEHLLNRKSIENESNTPDFILANYMLDCLQAFTVATQRREKWYGKAHAPGQSGE